MLGQRHVGQCAGPTCKQGVALSGTRLRRTGVAQGSGAPTSLHGRALAPLRSSGKDNPSPTDAASASAPHPASQRPTAVAEEAGTPAEPWTPDFIRELARREQEEEEREYNEAVVADFKADPEGLFDYVSRAYEEGPQVSTSAMSLLMDDLTGAPSVGWLPAVANDIVGMGTWRLRHMVDPAIAFLITRIEGSWREVLDTDLNLYPRPLWKDIGWDLVDSEDPTRELDGFSHADIPDPEPGAEGYPRLQLENRVYCSEVFRKLHVEFGIRQDGLQVLHVVIYPRYSYDLPIFGLDIVMVGERVTLAVVDCCPVRKDLKLQPYYMETMALLQKTFLADVDPAARRIPDWGRASFSPLAVCITPSTPEQLAAFIKYAVALHRAHMAISVNAAPVVASPGDVRTQTRLQELAAGQKRFCDNQLANKKTRRVLEAAFGVEWAEQYMSKLMFDWDPSYEPPFFDTEFEKLYHYFDENPEFGDEANAAYGLELQAEGDRAEETLQKALEGTEVPREKLNMAFEFLFQNDPKFRAAMQNFNGGQDEMSPEELADDFLAMLRGEPTEETEEVEVEGSGTAKV